MAKEGMVIKTESTKASVLITRKGACGGEGCSKCSGCEHQTQVIECANYISAKVGDRVQISGDDSSMLKYTVVFSTFNIFPNCSYIFLFYFGK